MKVYKSVLTHPGWEHKIKPLLRVEYYGREGRARVEVRSGITAKELAYLLAIRVRCATCGAPIFPFRPRVVGGRKREGHPFFAASCLLKVRIGCSRGDAATEEYAKVAVAVES